MKKYEVIIIGGGPAGRTIVHALHKRKADLSVLVIKDEALNVNRCAVPYGITATKPLEDYQIPNGLVTDFGADLLIDEVVSVSTDDRIVKTARNGRLGFGRLVFATGAKPWLPPIPGLDAGNVVAVRSLADLERLRDLARSGHRAAVIGAGYIGIEVTSVLREMGLDVSLIEAAANVLPSAIEPEFMTTIESRLVSKGVRLLTGGKAIAMEHGGSFGSQIRLENADSINADIVVLALGVRPNTALAEAAGLETSSLGIVVDQHMQTAIEGIYAAGDCAEARSFVSGRPVNSEFGTNAVFMARVVAGNILGEWMTFPGVVNASASMVFDLGFGAAGLTEAAARYAGFDVACGFSRVMDRYPMMAGVSEVVTKLVFDRASARLLGGSALRRGNGAAQGADFLSLAIQMKATMADIANYQYATHPELAAKPSDNAFVFAARAAMKNRRLPGPRADVEKAVA